MTNIYDVFFIMTFISVSIVTILQLMNIVNYGKIKYLENNNKEEFNFYNPVVSFMILMISYSISKIMLMLQPSILYAQLFRIETFLLSLSIILYILQIFIAVSNSKLTKLQIKPYMSNKNARN